MQFSTLKFRLASVGACGAVALAVAGPAFAHQSASPKMMGNAAAGKSLFGTTCGTCHTLKAAGSAGAIGPNLNKIPKLTEAEIITQITSGGTSVMMKTHQKTSSYAVTMQGYASLGKTKIDNLAAFVYKYQS
jgi:mono/diheme cytochrome c family protein